jgi:hypothetical protein
MSRPRQVRVLSDEKVFLAVSLDPETPDTSDESCTDDELLQTPCSRVASRSIAAALMLGVIAGVICLVGPNSTGADAKRAAVAADAVVARAEKVWAYLPPDSPHEWCHKIEDNTDYLCELIATVENVKTASMCCSACAGFPECGAWTWGKNYTAPGVGGICWIKKFSGNGTIKKAANTNVMSGVPHPNIVKFGVEPAPASTSHIMDGVVKKDIGPAPIIGATCPGKIAVAGHGTAVSLVNTFQSSNVSNVQVLEGDAVVSHMGARSYWGEWCNEGMWQPGQYVRLRPLGKTLRFSVDVSGTTCGCNAAFYFSAMPYNTDPGTCHGDYYCDVMSVCGTSCFELDVMEANQYAWRSTVHAVGDYMGKPMGYGGSEDSPVTRDWTSTEYSPGGKCIDTTKPFSVAVSFPTDDQGNLLAFEVELSQTGKPCTVKSRITEYHWGWPPPRKDGWSEFTKALQMGMTPVMSYWRSPQMLWMDGLGEDGRGPCVRDNPSQCPDHVRFYNFSLEEYRVPLKSTPPVSVV